MPESKGRIIEKKSLSTELFVVGTIRLFFESNQLYRKDLSLRRVIATRFLMV
jgi:hypothetical protein